MSRSIAFTAYLRVVPSRGRAFETHDDVRPGGRFDYVRDLQRLAVAVYDALQDAPEIMVATYGQNDLRSRIGSQNLGVGVRPQFGNNPSLLMFEGFYDLQEALDQNASPPLVSAGDEVIAQPAGRTTLFHANSVYNGYDGQQPWTETGMPTATVQQGVAGLRYLIDSVVQNVSDDTGNPPTVYKLLYNGILWGVGGHHFPALA